MDFEDYLIFPRRRRCYFIIVADIQYIQILLWACELAIFSIRYIYIKRTGPPPKEEKIGQFTVVSTDKRGIFIADGLNV